MIYFFVFCFFVCFFADEEEEEEEEEDPSREGITGLYIYIPNLLEIRASVSVPNSQKKKGEI